MPTDARPNPRKTPTTRASSDVLERLQRRADPRRPRRPRPGRRAGPRARRRPRTVPTRSEASRSSGRRTGRARPGQSCAVAVSGGFDRSFVATRSRRVASRACAPPVVVRDPSFVPSRVEVALQRRRSAGARPRPRPRRRRPSSPRRPALLLGGLEALRGPLLGRARVRARLGPARPVPPARPRAPPAARLRLRFGPFAAAPRRSASRPSSPSARDPGPTSVPGSPGTRSRRSAPARTGPGAALRRRSGRRSRHSTSPGSATRYASVARSSSIASRGVGDRIERVALGTRRFAHRVPAALSSPICAASRSWLRPRNVSTSAGSPGSAGSAPRPPWSDGAPRGASSRPRCRPSCAARPPVASGPSRTPMARRRTARRARLRASGARRPGIASA